MQETKNVYYWLRVINDISIEDEAKHLQISCSYVRAIEAGRKQPSKRLIRAFANYVDVDENIIIEFSKANTTLTKN